MDTDGGTDDEQQHLLVDKGQTNSSEQSLRPGGQESFLE